MCSEFKLSAQSRNKTDPVKAWQGIYTRMDSVAPGNLNSEEKNGDKSPARAKHLPSRQTLHVMTKVSTAEGAEEIVAEEKKPRAQDGYGRGINLYRLKGLYSIQ